jgi:predicted naringenin-chalcone synthase
LAEVESTGEHLFPDTLGIMGWKIDDTGFGIVLDAVAAALCARRSSGRR